MRRARLALGLATILVATACVRLDEPARFTCVDGTDCPSNQKCSAGGLCVFEGECIRSSDCLTTQRCDTATLLCVAAECHGGNTGVCGRYTCVDGLCKHDCLTADDCVLDSVCTFPPFGGAAAGNAGPRPKYRDEACTDASECDLGLRCCGTPKVCGDCYGTNVPCSRASDCESGFCCDGIFGLTCSYAACGAP